MTIKLSTGLRNKLLSSADFKTAFAGGVLEIYAGSINSSADVAITASAIVKITSSGQTHTASSASTAGGLSFSSASSGAIAKSSAQTWKDSSASSGTAAWFVLYDNSHTKSLSSAGTIVRLMGSCGVGSGDLRMSSTSIASGATITIDTFTITMPASA